MSQISEKELLGIKEDEKQETDEPKMYSVVLLNDDYTSMEFVVFILESVFRKSPELAKKIMLSVHNNGRGIAGVYTKEVAETKVAIVQALSRQNEFPLRCLMEVA